MMLITNAAESQVRQRAFGISVIGSQIVYVFSLIVADIMAEVYGYRRVRRLLYMSLVWLIVYAVALQIVVNLPPSKDFAIDKEFRTCFAQTPRIVFASITAYFVTELTNSFVMSRLKVTIHRALFLWPGQRISGDRADR